jgi:hypothetical protein
MIHSLYYHEWRAGIFDLPFYLVSGLHAVAIGLFYSQSKNIHANN